MIKTFQEYLSEIGEVGHIQSIVQSIVYVSGLPTIKPHELVVGEEGQQGIVQAIRDEIVEILMLDTKGLRNDLAIARTNQVFKIPAAKEVLGRVINPFGLPVDGAGPIGGEKEPRPVDFPAPPISQRVKIDRPFETGVTIVDILVPLGFGQRELVIGDKKIGKTTFLLQTVANQASKGTVCIYVGIGKRQNDIKNIENYLRRAGVFSNCVILVANSADPATVIYLSPLSGMALAEYFRDQGQDVLIILDDLSTHAKFYRELSLLSKRAPGRGSYPGDIFHLHASLLERAGNIRLANGKVVSITTLPVAETLESDITGYIQTNLMAITDGHLFFGLDLFEKGQRPAINHALSVSRVGNQTKTILERNLAQEIREALSRYEKGLEIARFGVELPEETQREISLGEKIELIFNQDADSRVPRGLGLLLMGLVLFGFWDEKTASLVKVDLIKLLQKYKDGRLAAATASVEKAKTFEELKAVVKNYSSKVTEVLYV